ncbi:MAG: hypothetical protein AB7R89_26785 [Dehalococcoidia bacterium]
MDTDPSGRKPVRMRRSVRSRVRRFFARFPKPRLPIPALNSGSMMLWGIGLILSSLILQRIVPALTPFVVIAGLILFFASFIVAFRHKDAGSVGAGDAYWRGQRYARSDLRGPSPLERLKTWWRQRNQRL